MTAVRDPPRSRDPAARVAAHLTPAGTFPADARGRR
jgi:hypothetical protein